ncbi:MAG: hypothetical protein ACU0DK_15525 [Pseudooceanicola sp.]
MAVGTPTLELTKHTRVPAMPSEVYQSMSFDARGELLLSWADEAGSVFVHCFESWHEPVEFKHQDFRYPTAQRFADGRWLITDSRCRETEKNARLFSQDLKLIRELRLGDAIEQIIVDPKDSIWVGYFDENPLGLREFSDNGDLVYDFNNSSGHNILCLYAMHLDSRQDLWVYPYTDFYLARVSDRDAQIVIDECPSKAPRRS